jgi:hypothetical protein
MSPACAALLAALREPAAMAGFDASVWDSVVRQAAAAGVLGRLGALARETGIDEALPPPVRRHMQALLTIAGQQQRAVRWELVQLSRTLADLAGPVLLLKGAAYAAADLPPAAGRLFADIDLMVPKSQIDAAEAALMLDGWNSSHHEAYDQRYYRRWMHELPPMRHIRRQTVLDLHHSILPETARIRVDPAPMLAAARPLPEFPRFSIPTREDQVLHSATHLFHEGEWQHGLRDLVDLDAMLRAYADDPAFLGRLMRRAEELGLGRPLFLGLRHAERHFATPLPQGLLDRCPDRSGPLQTAVMDRLFDAAFATAHDSCRTPLSGVAAWILYIRSHWLRMPPNLLVPHLIRKSWQRYAEKMRGGRERRTEDET